MTPENVLGDRVPPCDGHHGEGGCLRCYLLPRLYKALYAERVHCGEIALTFDSAEWSDQQRNVARMMAHAIFNGGLPATAPLTPAKIHAIEQVLLFNADICDLYEKRGVPREELREVFRLAATRDTKVEGAV